MTITYTILSENVKYYCLAFFCGFFVSKPSFINILKTVRATMILIRNEVDNITFSAMKTASVSHTSKRGRLILQNTAV